MSLLSAQKNAFVSHYNGPLSSFKYLWHLRWDANPAWPPDATGDRAVAFPFSFLWQNAQDIISLLTAFLHLHFSLSSWSHLVARYRWTSPPAVDFSPSLQFCFSSLGLSQPSSCLSNMWAPPTLPTLCHWLTESKIWGLCLPLTRSHGYICSLQPLDPSFTLWWVHVYRTEILSVLFSS